MNYSRRRNVLILFNRLDDEASIAVEPFIENFNELDTFLLQLEKNGFTVKLRWKGQCIYRNLFPKANQYQVAQGSLDDWFDWTDICISIFQPTSALIKFWEKGAICIHVQGCLLNWVHKLYIPAYDCNVFQGTSYADSFSKIIDLLKIPLP